MPDPLYALTKPTAQRVQQLVADGGTTARGPAAAAPPAGQSWVKVTGAAVSGWYPGVVSLDQAGTFTDLTVPVQVSAADGSALAAGRRYLCARTGPAADGTPRFRVQDRGAFGVPGRNPEAFLLGLDLNNVHFRADADGGITAYTAGVIGCADGFLTPKFGAEVLAWESAPGSGAWVYLPIQFADASHFGYVSANAQTFGGNKTFAGNVSVQGDGAGGTSAIVGGGVLFTFGVPPAGGLNGLQIDAGSGAVCNLSPIPNLLSDFTVNARIGSGLAVDGYVIATGTGNWGTTNDDAAAFKVRMPGMAGGTLVPGVSGTLGPGAKAVGGIIWDKGSGTFFSGNAADLTGTLDGGAW